MSLPPARHPEERNYAARAGSGAPPRRGPCPAPGANMHRSCFWRERRAMWWTAARLKWALILAWRSQLLRGAHPPLADGERPGSKRPGAPTRIQRRAPRWGTRRVRMHPLHARLEASARRKAAARGGALGTRAWRGGAGRVCGGGATSGCDVYGLLPAGRAAASAAPRAGAAACRTRGRRSSGGGRCRARSSSGTGGGAPSGAHLARSPCRGSLGLPLL